MAPNPTLAFVGGPCCLTLDFVYDYVLHIVNVGILYYYMQYLLHEEKSSQQRGQILLHSNNIGLQYMYKIPHISLIHIYATLHEITHYIYALLKKC
jgi:hypothetical protein